MTCGCGWSANMIAGERADGEGRAQGGEEGRDMATVASSICRSIAKLTITVFASEDTKRKNYKIQNQNSKLNVIINK